jgi:hypothetical protein
MTDAEAYQRRVALSRSGGVCEVCGAPLAYGMQGAHRIANTIPNRRKYGSLVIDHPLNIGIVCRDMACNDALNIGQNPGKILELLADIVTYEIRHFSA